MTTHIQIGDISPRIQYEGDGSQTAFPYPFAIFTADDLLVYQDEDLLTGGYTVSGAGDSDGGTVTFATAPASGQRITLLRRLTIARVSDFQEGGPLRASALNDELDERTAVDQQLDEALSRALILPPTVAEGITGALPPPEAGAVIGWNTEATALVNDPLNYAGLAADLAVLRDGVPEAVAACAQAEQWAKDAALSAWLVGLNEDGAGDTIATAVAAAGRAERWAEDAAWSAWMATTGQEGSEVPGADDAVTYASLTTTGAVVVGGPLEVAGETATVPLLDYAAARFTVFSASIAESATLDLTDGEVQVLTLGADSVVTLPDPPTGRGYSLTLKLVQDATGGRAPSFQQADGTAARWLGDSAPAWRSTEGALDLVVVTHDGTDLIAAHVGGAD